MHGVLNDLRFGLRQLAAKPGFAAAAILTLALGIGANAAVFSVLNGYLFKPLPYPNGGQLVRIDESFLDEALMHGGMSVPMYDAIRDEASALSDSALFAYSDFDLQIDGRAKMVEGALVTPSVFSVLGTRPFLGHTFSADATQPANGLQLVLSYAFWQQQFGGNPDVIGDIIHISGAGYKVVGIMPKGFAFTNRAIKLWVPMTITAAAGARKNLFNTHAGMIARLKPGFSIAAAEPDLHGILVNAVRQGDPEDRKAVARGAIKITLTPWRQAIAGDKTETALLLQAAVLVLLLITCVNVANLLLSRLFGRMHEIALRVALGASGWKLARQLLIEGLYLALPGGAIGLALAWWSLQFFAASAIGPGDEVISLQPDWHVAVFAAAVVAVAGLVVSLLPLWQLRRVDLQSLLQEGGRVAGGNRARRVRQVLVVSELALATVLLTGSGLLLHSLVRIQRVNPGYRLDNVLLAQTVMTADDNTQRNLAFFRNAEQKVSALPGVDAVGLTSVVPFQDSHHVSNLAIRGSSAPPPSANIQFVDGGFFRALDVPILKGRGFDLRDRNADRQVIVINQLLAERAFPHGDAIGKQIQIPGRYAEKWFTVVGIVPTLKIYSLSEPVERGTIYLPYSQVPIQGLPRLGIVIKTSVSPSSLSAGLRDAVHTVDPTVALYNVEPIHGRMLETLNKRQATLNLVAVFGGIALALAFIGVFGVMSYAVGQRTVECGVRLALGALPGNLMWLIIKDGLKLLAAGLIAGLLLAVIAGFVLAAQLFDVAPYDPVVLAGTAAVLSAITLIACYLPARRAAKLDPATAMMEQ
jgi:predicted permease